MANAAACLQANDIDVLVIKGQATARIFYPDPSMRGSADLDLLVREGEMARAAEVLKAEVGGSIDELVKPGWKYRKSITTRDQHGVQLDVHQRLADGYFGLKANGLFDEFRYFTVGPAVVAMPPPEVLFIGACFHESLGGSSPLSTALDVALGLQSDSVDLDRVLQLAGGWQVSAAVGAGVRSALARLALPDSFAPEEYRSLTGSSREQNLLSQYGDDRRFALLQSQLAMHQPTLRAKLGFATAWFRPSQELLEFRGITRNDYLRLIPNRLEAIGRKNFERVAGAKPGPPKKRFGLVRSDTTVTDPTQDPTHTLKDRTGLPTRSSLNPAGAATTDRRDRLRESPTPEPKLRVLAWPARRARPSNPYSYLLQQHTKPFGIDTYEFTPRNLLRFDWDVIHIHWPDTILGHKGMARQAATAAGLLGALRLHQARGAAIVWTVHNLKAHDVLYPKLGSQYMSRFVAMVDGILSPSEFGLAEIRGLYPRLNDVPAAVSRIGDYRAEYPTPPVKDEARLRLGLPKDAQVVLSLGHIRHYKNLPRLLQIFKDTEGSNLRLVIAGKPVEAEIGNELEALARDDPRVELRLGRVPEEEIPVLFAASDLVALPFSKILNSSSALLALSFDRPVLAPSIGALPELAEAVGRDWVRLYSGELDPEKLSGALAAPTAATPNLETHSWPTIGSETAGFFHMAAGRSGGTRGTQTRVARLSRTFDRGTE